MKIKLAVLVALSLVACNKPVVVQAPPPTPIPATPEPIAMVTPPPATPVATPSDLAPDGVFWLVEGVSIQSDDGVLGFKAGQLLHKIGAGIYTAGETKLTLRDDQVTNHISAERAILARQGAVDTALRQAAAITPVPTPYTVQVEKNYSQHIDTIPTTGKEAVHDKSRSMTGYYDIWHRWHYYPR